jgi:hypothetical protein
VSWRTKIRLLVWVSVRVLETGRIEQRSSGGVSAEGRAKSYPKAAVKPVKLKRMYAHHVPHRQSVEELRLCFLSFL